MKKKEKAGTAWRPEPKDKRLYTLDVFIISGPMNEKFAKKNKVISRTIQIRGEPPPATILLALQEFETSNILGGVNAVEERLSHIASVDPDILKAVDLAEKLGDLRQRREKANALVCFCADALRIVLATKGINL